MSESETITSPKYRLVGDLFFEATGEKTASNTISRIAASGRLECVKILGAWRCTESAFLEFISAPAKARNQAAPKPALRSRTEAAKAKLQAAAIAECEANGIL